MRIPIRENSIFCAGAGDSQVPYYGSFEGGRTKRHWDDTLPGKSSCDVCVSVFVSMMVCVWGGVAGEWN